MTMQSHYTEKELSDLGVTFGKKPQVHRSAILLNPGKLRLGDFVRIDCFCVLSAGDAGITIGRNVHLGASVLIYGGGGKVTLEDFVGLSARVTLYSSTDDYREGYLTNPTVPERFRKVTSGAVTLKKHVIIGSGSVLLPGITLETGVSVGALSLVNKNVGEFLVVMGNPLKHIGERGRQLLELEQALLAEEAGSNR